MSVSLLQVYVVVVDYVTSTSSESTTVALRLLSSVNGIASTLPRSASLLRTRRHLKTAGRHFKNESANSDVLRLESSSETRS